MAALGAVLNIVMMMVANLVGFVIGTDGARFFVDELFGTISGVSLLNFYVPCVLMPRGEGIRFLVGACCCLFVGAQLMFEYRQVVSDVIAIGFG